MNYKEWSENYERETENLKKIIEKERNNLNKSDNYDEIKSINRRIQILKSMYYECKLTARFLQSKAEKFVTSVGDFVA